MGCNCGGSGLTAAGNDRGKPATWSGPKKDASGSGAKKGSSSKSTSKK